MEQFAAIGSATVSEYDYLTIREERRLSIRLSLVFLLKPLGDEMLRSRKVGNLLVLSAVCPLILSVFGHAQKVTPPPIAYQSRTMFIAAEGEIGGAAEFNDIGPGASPGKFYSLEFERPQVWEHLAPFGAKEQVNTLWMVAAR